MTVIGWMWFLGSRPIPIVTALERCVTCRKWIAEAKEPEAEECEDGYGYMHGRCAQKAGGQA